MGNPYGGYGPAEAMRDAGSSLADIVKEFAGVKLAEARLGLENKKLTLESDRVKAGLTKDIALAELASETEQAGIRRGTAQDVETARHSKEMEGIARTGADTQASLATSTIAHQRALEGIAGKQASMAKEEFDVRMTEAKLLDKKDTWGSWVQNSGLPPAYKTMIEKHTDPEDWNRQIAGRDWKMFIEGSMKNPKLIFDGLIAGLDTKVREAREKIGKAGSQEEIEAIIEKEYAPAISHLMQMKTIIGEGPEFTQDQMIKIGQLGMAAYKAAPENYPGGAQEALNQTLSAAQAANKAYWDSKYPTADQIKGSIKKAAGEKVKQGAEEKLTISAKEMRTFEAQGRAVGIDVEKVIRNAEKKAAAGDTKGAFKTYSDAIEKMKAVKKPAAGGAVSETTDATRRICGKTERPAQNAWGMEGYEVAKKEEPKAAPEEWPENLADMAAQIERVYGSK